VRLAIARRVAARHGAHPFARLLGGGVLGARLRRDQRDRPQLVEGGVGVLAGIAAVGREL
jgi:hypothetical protein